MAWIERVKLKHRYVWHVHWMEPVPGSSRAKHRAKSTGRDDEHYANLLRQQAEEIERGGASSLSSSQDAEAALDRFLRNLAIEGRSKRTIAYYRGHLGRVLRAKEVRVLRTPPCSRICRGDPVPPLMEVFDGEAGDRAARPRVLRGRTCCAHA